VAAAAGAQKASRRPKKLTRTINFMGPCTGTKEQDAATPTKKRKSEGNAKRLLTRSRTRKKIQSDPFLAFVAILKRETIKKEEGYQGADPFLRYARGHGREAFVDNGTLHQGTRRSGEKVKGGMPLLGPELGGKRFGKRWSTAALAADDYRNQKGIHRVNGGKWLSPTLVPKRSGESRE